LLGLLHDIGKIQIPISVLNKKEGLTQQEFEVIKQHPVYGFEILKTTELKNLDSELVKLFIDNISVHYVGTEVLLGSGEVGEIAYIPPQCVMNPIIKIENEYFDSYSNRGKMIVQMI